MQCGVNHAKYKTNVRYNVCDQNIYKIAIQNHILLDQTIKSMELSFVINVNWVVDVKYVRYTITLPVNHPY